MMTKKELRQLYYLNREIMNDTEELVKLKIKSRNCEDTEWGRAQEILIAEREREIVDKVKRCKELRNKINDFINSIDDSWTRQIFYYRFSKCMSWKKVAYMTGGPISEDGARMIVDRYLKGLE